MQSHLRLSAVLVCTFLGIFCRAGSLQPSAAPTVGTMKPLSDVEPRIAIHQSDMPLVIGTSGSYYLAEDVTSTGHGIIVGADNVTIDLNGFTMSGSGSASVYGVYMSNSSNLEIRNGTIQNFSYGICDSSTTGKGNRVFNVRVTNCVYVGIYFLGSNYQIRGCTVSDIGTLSTNSVYGICCGSYSSITGNSVYNIGNSSTGSDVYGVYASLHNLISDNTVCNNGVSSTARVYGIMTNNYNTIRHNVICRNGVSTSGTKSICGILGSYGCTISDNVCCMNGDSTTTSGTVYGLYASSGSTITGNSVYYNGHSAAGDVYGVIVSIACTVTNNTIYRNGLSASGTTYGLVLSSYGLVNNNTIYSHGTNLSTGTGCVFGTNVAP